MQGTPDNATSSTFWCSMQVEVCTSTSCWDASDSAVPLLVREAPLLPAAGAAVSAPSSWPEGPSCTMISMQRGQENLEQYTQLTCAHSYGLKIFAYTVHTIGDGTNRMTLTMVSV